MSYTAHVNTSKLLSELDKQIARLREARNLLADESVAPARKTSRKRNLSKDARAKMAAAQKRRWAAYRKKKK